MGWLIAGVVILLMVLLTVFFCGIMSMGKRADIQIKKLWDERRNSVMQDEQKAKRTTGGSDCCPLVNMTKPPKCRNKYVL